MVKLSFMCLTGLLVDPNSRALGLEDSVAAHHIYYRGEG
jgi:hypothetical protein